MRLAIMQPYFFPYIGYWQLLNLVDLFVIYDDVNFIKKGYINRNSILINGKAQLINLELVGASQNKLINEIQVGKNKKKLLKTIELNYKKAPYFDNAFAIIHDILENDEENLAKFIGYSLQKISGYIGITTEFIYSSNIENKDNKRSQDRIIQIASMTNASHYINPRGGMELYDKKTFLNNNIDLSFIESIPIKYKQFNNTFEPNLSIIDVMMFNKKTEINAALLGYKLI